jgi:transposase
MWKDAPMEYGPHETLYNRWVRWCRMGIFAAIMTEPAARGQHAEMVMIDPTHRKAHHTASSLAVQKGGAGG